MATTVHEPPKIYSPASPLFPTMADGTVMIPPAGSMTARVEDSSPASRTGIWVGIAAITMTFVAFTSAMVVRQGASHGLAALHLALGALSRHRRIAGQQLSPWKWRANGSRLFARGVADQPLASAAVALADAGTRIAVRRRAIYSLAATQGAGLYLATNPSSSFFYLFTAVHALHVLGGLAGLMLVIWRFSRPVPTLRLSTLSTVSYYWHFMDVLWIYLLLLLWTRI